MNNLKNEYISNIKRNLKVPTKYKKDFLQNLENSVEEYINENPTSSYKDIEEAFGSVEDIIESFYESMEKEEILKKIRLKKIIFIGIISVLIMLVVSSMVYASYLENLKGDIPVYKTENIIE